MGMVLKSHFHWNAEDSLEIHKRDYAIITSEAGSRNGLNEALALALRANAQGMVVQRYLSFVDLPTSISYATSVAFECSHPI